MHLAATTKERVGSLVVSGIAILLFILTAIHAVRGGSDLPLILYGVLIPGGFESGVLIGGIWLWVRDGESRNGLRVAAWCISGMIVLAISAILMTRYEQAEGVMLTDQLFVVVEGASIGALGGFVVGAYDESERAFLKRSERLSRQLTVLSRTLRHDIRTDANIISGNAERLTETDTDTDKIARTIQQQANDLVKIGEQAKGIEQLLDRPNIARKAIDLTSVVKSACDRIQRDWPNSEISVTLPESMIVYAHPVVETAISNVIENAVEHTDKQTPRVEITSETGPQTDSVELRIADNGPGIPETTAIVLERGYETDLEHLDGLGLWLAWWIVSNSGGEIWFKETDSEGSVVCLQFEQTDSETNSG